jgi:hypothetical protein
MSNTTISLEDKNVQPGFPLGRDVPTLDPKLVASVIFTKTTPVDGHYALIELGSLTLDGEYRSLADITTDTARELHRNLKHLIKDAEELDREP